MHEVVYNAMHTTGLLYGLYQCFIFSCMVVTSYVYSIDYGCSSCKGMWLCSSYHVVCMYRLLNEVEVGCILSSQVDDKSNPN